MKNIFSSFLVIFLVLFTASASFSVKPSSTTSGFSCADYSMIPPFLTEGMAPLVMLVMERDHKLFYEAYNDASDINNDGNLDLLYKPNEIDYYGYFDSEKCYIYNNSVFVPSSISTNKTCSGSTEWSGDFLNYLTTSRMDALRKVFYGGYRSIDNSTETILSRAYIPQDGHSWGKEYESIAHDGYDIRDYTPLNLPDSGTRHLIASTTLENNNPVLRILPNNTHRIWEWVSQETPVACSDSDSGYSGSHCSCCETSGGTYSSYPGNHEEYEDLVLQFANDNHKQGSGNATQINGSGNPFGSDDYYLNIFSGYLNIINAGNYTFAVNGDDAVEFILDGEVVAGWYEGHGEQSSINNALAYQDIQVTKYLDAGQHLIEFRHQEKTGGDTYYLGWNGTDSNNTWEYIPTSFYSDLVQTTYNVSTNASLVTDYILDVKVCDPAMLESNCKQYPNGNYKPIGLLQKYGESNRMFFGLITGSYEKNTSGGVLRKNIASITNEISNSTGEILSTNGIIDTLNKIKIDNFDYSDFHYDGCGLITTRSINEGECQDWGNPIGEMVYEAVRYFAGESTATSDFLYTESSSTDQGLGLSIKSWNNPFDTYQYCSRPYILVLSDINPSYDSDQLPGISSNFGTFSDTFKTMNVQNIAKNISDTEGLNGTYFIGQSGSLDDSSCFPKALTGFKLGDVRGLCPEEPTKKGSYYAAAAAYYAKTNDIGTANGTQNVDTYSIALASPLPKIDINVGGSNINILPFGKSVGGSSISQTRGNFQPTNTIVDFYVDTLNATYGKFRINFEDVEQGNDHDMDAIAVFEYQVTDSSNNTVVDPVNGTQVIVNITSEYAAGSIIQHLGYIISGSTKDGTYLVVRDEDTSNSSDVDYFLDTPPGVEPNKGVTDTAWSDNASLPLFSSRVFIPGHNSTAENLNDPLWYTAKWGTFNDLNNSTTPDDFLEWDKNEDGLPDNYFLVTNALELEQKLNSAFSMILNRLSSGSAASLISSSRSGEGAIFQAVFWPKWNDDQGNQVDWIGDVHGFLINQEGLVLEDSNQNDQLDSGDERIILYFDENVGRARGCSNGTVESGVCTGTVKEFDQIKYLWSAAEWLYRPIMDVSITQNRDINSFTTDDTRRYIFTWYDSDGNGTINDTDGLPGDTEEILNFTSSNINLSYCNSTIVNWIRGLDQNGTRSRKIRVDSNKDGSYDQSVTWKLSDIIHSTPVVVGTPSENYDLYWGDTSYTAFYKKYRKRRTMVYFGANDGMLHAVNSGFYSTSNKKFYTEYNSGTYSSNGTSIGLGGEMWAYVPYNLLPHLRCLTAQGYEHAYYVDLRPRTFDVKIFTADADHPSGWGTILVGGMRFGGSGKPITVDGRDFTSSFFILDITNPEKPPRLLGEITVDTDDSNMLNIGYSTSVPTVIPSKNTSGVVEWNLVLGNGPDNIDGSSSQKAKLIIIPLKKLIGTSNTPNSSFGLRIPGCGSCKPTKDAAGYYDVSGTGCIGTDFVSVDYNFDFWTDILYYGTVEGSVSSWSGGLHRLKVEDEDDPSKWEKKEMINAGRPVTGAPNIGFYGDDVWVYFGTGRFWTIADKMDAETQFLFGIREPKFTNSNAYNFAQVSFNPANPGNSWVKSSDINVRVDDAGLNCTDGTTDCLPTVSGGNIDTFSGLQDYIVNTKSINGWFRELKGKGERIIGQPTLLGGLVTATSYRPSDDLCSSEGESKLYAVYYLTGTAWKENVFGDEDTDFVEYEKDLGKGMSITPSLHLGSEEGAKAFVQTSTGEIVEVEQPNLPIKNVHSGRGGWHTHDID